MGKALRHDQKLKLAQRLVLKHSCKQESLMHVLLSRTMPSHSQLHVQRQDPFPSHKPGQHTAKAGCLQYLRWHAACWHVNLGLMHTLWTTTTPRSALPTASTTRLVLKAAPFKHQYPPPMRIPTKQNHNPTRKSTASVKQVNSCIPPTTHTAVTEFCLWCCAQSARSPPQSV